jgi:preprotein translocase subunit SecY
VAGKNATGMLSGMSNIAEIKQRLAFVFFALIVYRIGTFIPIPGVNPAALQQFFDQNTAPF